MGDSKSWLVDQLVTLKGGRQMAILDGYSPRAPTLFYFHGFPGSRWEALLLAGAARNAGIRLIGIDRPGIGRSSVLRNRSLLDWPNDVVELADHLGVERFSVLGFSGGGPYALACALKIPNRLSACGLAAGAGPVSGIRAALSRILPWITLPVLRHFFRNSARAERAIAHFEQYWPGPDRECLNRDDVTRALAQSLAGAFRTGSIGTIREAMLLGGAWGFNISDISFAQMYLWHGELDAQIPVSVGRAVAASLRHCSALYYPADGHVSLLANHAESIVRTLTCN